LDLVDGTPILDIKPYVPQYDCVGYNDDVARRRRRRADDVCDDEYDEGVDREINGGGGGGIDGDDRGIVSASFPAPRCASTEGGARVPDWVESVLRKRRDVSIHPDARRFLRDLATSTDVATDAIMNDREDDANARKVDGVESTSGGRGGVGDTSSSMLSCMQFYGPHTPWKDDPRDAAGYIENCIIETLEADVRSAWQTGKARGGKFQAERSRRLAGNGATAAVAAAQDDGGTGNDVGDDDRPRLCTQQIDNLLVGYTIEERRSGCMDERSAGSGAEDVVVVRSISHIG
jgi:hypothetical protein